MQSPKGFSPSQRPSWLLLPLRLFLSITFIYAGLQKLFDPQFFDPRTAGYIGKQIIGFAQSSPLHDFLLQVALPHATLFGLLVAYGEIAIGLGTLVGLLLRPAAFFGLLLSLLLFLSATWSIYPYFYGSDIVFVFCWLTLLLNGPTASGLPTLDEFLGVYLLQHTPPQQQQKRAQLLHFLLGISIPSSIVPTQNEASTRRTSRSTQRPGRRYPASRRNFLFGLFTGVAGMLSLTGIAYAYRVLTQHDTPTSSNSTPSSGTSQNPLTPPPSVPGASPTATTTGASIAKSSAVPQNSAVTFALPSGTNPGILVHLPSGQFVAYDSTCTHAGCPVDYDPDSHLLICPCHGAQYDPAQQAAVVHRPARSPLTSVAISVDSATGNITLTQ